MSALRLSLAGEGVGPDLVMSGSKEQEGYDDSSRGLTGVGLPSGCATLCGVT